MSLSGVNPDIDDAPGPAQPEPPGTGRRWSVPHPPRLSLPVTGMLIFAGIRVLSVAVAAFLLGHQRQLDQLQAALLAARRPADPPFGPAAGSAADFGAGAAHRRPGRRDDLVRPVPDGHRPLDALSAAWTGR